jgi:glutamyl-tRNA(Gln) amidotransferase subunit E
VTNQANDEPAGVRPPADHNPRTDPPLDFPDRAFGELTPADYDALGFMGGLEVHQQLLTRGKLFCRCPAALSTDRVDAEVLRHMRPTLSELGEYDGTALMEFKTKKEIVYQLDRRSICTYEIDDTPPFPIDLESVLISLEIARLFELNLVSELHVMRKQYLDGSIPTGFQRTAMVGLTGEIPFRESEVDGSRPLRIRQLSLEEDSCREVEDVGHRIVFRTDRLGTPLIETVTEPDLLTPRDVAQAGLLLARVARSTGKVRRGPGAARQDVNVSVAGGRRIEIKGVPNLRLIPVLVHNEALRQLNLLRIRAELQRRGVGEDALPIPEKEAPWDASSLVADVKGALQGAGDSPARRALERGETVCAVRLPGFAGLLAHPTQPGLPFAHELNERVRVIACPVTPPFLAHSDRPDEMGISGTVWREARQALSATGDDAVVLVWMPREDAATAAREVLIRARETLAGIPAETRQPWPDGRSGFERILPGPDRMYPDTDTPPLPIEDAWLKQIELSQPERPWQRAQRYENLGLSRRAAYVLVDAPWQGLFDALAPRGGEPARRLAAALERRLVHHWRLRDQREIPTDDRLRPLVRAIEQQRVRPEAFDEIFDRLLAETRREAESIIAGYEPREGDRDTLEQLVQETAAKRGAVAGKPAGAVLRWGMGRVMRPLLGKMDPETVKRRLAQALQLEEVRP